MMRDTDVKLRIWMRLGSSSRHHDWSCWSYSQLFGTRIHSSCRANWYLIPPNVSNSFPSGVSNNQKSGRRDGDMSCDVSPCAHIHTPEVPFPYHTPWLLIAGRCDTSDPVTIGSEVTNAAGSGPVTYMPPYSLTAKSSLADMGARNANPLGFSGTKIAGCVVQLPVVTSLIPDQTISSPMNVSTLTPCPNESASCATTRP